MSNEQTRPAVAGQVEPKVRPVAWMWQTVESGTRVSLNEPSDYETAHQLEPLFSKAELDAARMDGVRSVQEQTGVIVRAALELLEAIEGETPFTAEATRAFKRVFGA